MEHKTQKSARKKGEYEDTEDIYDDSQRLEQMEEDEIDPAEAGFVEGHQNTKQTKREIEHTFLKKKNKVTK